MYTVQYTVFIYSQKLSDESMQIVVYIYIYMFIKIECDDDMIIIFDYWLEYISNSLHDDDVIYIYIQIDTFRE